MMTMVCYIAHYAVCYPRSLDVHTKITLVWISIWYTLTVVLRITVKNTSWSILPTMKNIAHHKVYCPPWSTLPTMKNIAHHKVHCPPWSTRPTMKYIAHHEVHCPPWSTLPTMKYIAHHTLLDPPMKWLRTLLTIMYMTRPTDIQTINRIIFT